MSRSLPCATGRVYFHKSPPVRQYTEREIEILRTIKHLLRDKGLTIEGAQAQLKVKQSPLELRADTLTRLREIRSRLEALRKALT